MAKTMKSTAKAMKAMKAKKDVKASKLEKKRRAVDAKREVRHERILSSIDNLCVSRLRDSSLQLIISLLEKDPERPAFG